MLYYKRMGSNWHNGISYVQPGDPEAWVDWPEPRKNPPHFMSGDSERCGICRGHGGWNLLLGAYPSPRENTSENRHLYSHMKATCHGCAGHGWIRTSEKRCVHEFRWTGVMDRRTQFTCVHCKHTVVWDTRRRS